ncbi:MAG: hypothetical protein K2H09_07240 [Treponemataceae bacterium]|nr:hypothetical protein [Treponemataceae bacterium]
MAESEINVITHLLDVEQKAAELIRGVQEEANSRISAARAQADAEYKAQYDALVQDLERQYQQKVAGISESHRKALEAYKAEIQKAPQNDGAFRDFLKKELSEQ